MGSELIVYCIEWCLELEREQNIVSNFLLCVLRRVWSGVQGSLAVAS